MNVWKLVGAEKLELNDEPLPAPEEGKLKIRVTNVLLCNPDVDVFLGNLKIKYPLIPGRFGIGIIAEDGAAFYPKGTRVALHAFTPAPDPGTAKKDFSEDDYLISGLSRDGFLRDILYLSPDEITPIPDSVNDEEALLLHHVAFAKAAVDKLGAQKGEHVTVVGANLLGILICQLLIYQQVAPILVDAHQSRLDFASAAGIYYTRLSDENLLDNVAAITGGRLADGAIFVTGASGGDINASFLTCARDMRVVVCGVPPCDLHLDLNLALRKRLSVECISDCVDYLETAINLFANKAVDISCFTARSAKENEVLELFRTISSQEDHDVDSFDYVSLL